MNSVRVWTSFILSVLVASTTPLAIQWSQQGVGLFFAVSVRMMIGLTLCLGLLRMTRTPFSRSDQAIRTYLVGGLGFFFGITCSYWGLQFIPSGWTAVLFGLSPVFNGLLAKYVLSEVFGWNRVLGSLLGLAGLCLIFIQGMQGEIVKVGLGIGVTLLSVIIFSTTTVIVKKTGRDLGPMAITVGSLMVMIPCFWASWFLTEGVLPTAIPWRSLGAILYLAGVSTVIGFVALYDLLKHVDASVAALPNLISPLIAVGLGVILNDETLQPGFILGAMFVLAGLVLFQWGIPNFRTSS
ncbi:MAG: DMT family transporter [Magnetococcales bacterium]|nr:DMT family transporter [Magnetococcales bacterium]MBF0149994.1 DMT family transporter [Magnetococcales bacterium]MBF0174251.1 DMT family transporter [Magnetococcales bacterium]MBF0347779.1 DMT family transporter [Magnetococcales bacterium]MBF0631278.1 DMT family transporter [Magnetococcales bacterium]